MVLFINTIFYSFCGFKEAVTFKHITTQEIDDTQNYIKTKLLSALEENSKNPEDVPINKKDFFGSLFEKNTASFEFLPGERILIIELTQHIKRIVDCDGIPNSGIKYFSFTGSNKKKFKSNHRNTKYYSQFGGRLFVSEEIILSTKTQTTMDLNVNNNIHDEKNNMDSLKEQLVRDVNKWFPAHSFNVENLPTDEGISVEIDADGKVFGLISCVYCKIDFQKSNSIKVSLKQTDTSNYWIFSNFSTHVKRCHSAWKIDHNFDNDITEIKTKLKNKKQYNSKKGKMLKNNCKTLKTPKRIFKEENSNIVELSIEVMNVNNSNAMMEDIESEIYKQISNQILGMTKTLQSEDTCYEMTFNIDASKEKLIYRQITGDGNCLFRTLAHQIYKENLGTEEQDKSMKKIRADVVSYINNNFTLFEWQLRGIVLDKFDNAPVDFEKEAREFVNEKLSTDAWGGVETNKAVSLMHEVNILIVNEDDKCYFSNGFNRNYKETIILAHKLAQRCVEDEASWISCGDDTNIDGLVEENYNLYYNHYDSVILMEPDVILKIANTLAVIEHKKLNYLEESHISLDSV